MDDSALTYEFEVLYTRHKTQRKKAWQDGVLYCTRCLGFDKAVLTSSAHDDHDGTRSSSGPVETFQLDAAPAMLNPGADIESPAYLIQIQRRLRPPATAEAVSAQSDDAPDIHVPNAMRAVRLRRARHALPCGDKVLLPQCKKGRPLHASALDACDTQTDRDLRQIWHDVTAHLHGGHVCGVYRDLLSSGAPCWQATWLAPSRFQ